MWMLPVTAVSGCRLASSTVKITRRRPWVQSRVIRAERVASDVSVSSSWRRSIRRLVLRVCVVYLRYTPFRRGQRALLRFCRESLLPELPAFSDAVAHLSARPDISMRCFQLGGEHHADILSEWLLFTGVWQPPG